jgi:phosphotransferase system enzyme I (PtsI)
MTGYDPIGDTTPPALRGIGAAPGYAIGHAHLLGRRKLEYPRYHLAPTELAAELERFEVAIVTSEGQLQSILSSLSASAQEHEFVLKAHLLILRDEMLAGAVVQAITERSINVEWALSKVVRSLKEIFGNIEDEYFRERRSDVTFVGDRIMRNLLGTAQPQLSAIDAGAIIVAHELSPADTAQLDRRAVLGFATDVGGKTSHTAIMARSMELPAVVALESATDDIGQGDLVIVDGVAGWVIVNPSPSELARYKSLQANYNAQKARLDQHAHDTSATPDGRTILVRGNIESALEASVVRDTGGEGVGLFRTEYLFMNQALLPDEDTQYAVYRDALERSAPHSVTIRTLDVGGDKLIEPLKRHVELNPVMGLRAIRFCLQQPKLFNAQLRALLRASVHGKLRIMIPLVSGLDEIDAAKAQLATARAELEAEGHRVADNIPFGVMIELPSAAMLADYMADEVDFFSIGTNDLIQYTLAVDRANEQVAHLYQPLHPAVLRMLETIVRAAHGAGIDVSMCGEMAGDPFYTPVLIGLGLRTLSMNAASISLAKSVIRAVSESDCRALYTELRQIRRVAQVRERVAEWLLAHLEGKIPLEVFDPEQHQA